MTTIRQELAGCVLCGQQTFVTVLGSTSTFGPPDLDLRPSEPARSSLFAWIQRCSACGYCAPSIGQATPYTREVVEGVPYRSLLADPFYPELARAFLCSSICFEQIGEEASAARNAIEAAWACDDDGAVEAAIKCRVRAAMLLRDSQGEGDELFADAATENAVLVDLLRRAGRFEEAIEAADDALPDADGTTADVLAFSRARALAGDPGRYTVEDALAGGGGEDDAIVAALRELVAFGERGDYTAKSVVLGADDERNYYVQFAVDEGGLFCEVVHNKYLEPEHAFTGDDIATLLALGFAGPDHEDQNLYRVFRPETDDDYAAIVSIVRAVVTDFFGLPPGRPLALGTSW
jgi:hypothetical protein